MALILNIDCSTETASVSIAEKGVVLLRLINNDQKDHASWIHRSIRDLLANASLELNELHAIAVTAGPGSYTGIRVGMASAKGLAYALSVPLITENTLRVMAWSKRSELFGQGDAGGITKSGDFCYAPMIDARRDEVFTGIYGPDLSELIAPKAIKLDQHAFEEELVKNRIIFFGSGSDKWKTIKNHQNAHFQNWDYAYFNLAYLAYQSYLDKAFADLAYVTPYYLKEVYTYKKN
ncbi:MAG: tRNA (adenosine(37)-N6)-threonylcarbamoyltransferase complex dimerization subunit type 1 TsaB [Chitinophagaceae bacterium]|nr:MAG: tRNA (adenosine(37)-N6)-threonylcarbamoyltransferase complex dimerization subunit type 1 TsaB [Chitinophagaceae bacterium]